MFPCHFPLQEGSSHVEWKERPGGKKREGGGVPERKRNEAQALPRAAAWIERFYELQHSPVPGRRALKPSRTAPSITTQPSPISDHGPMFAERIMQFLPM